MIDNLKREGGSLWHGGSGGMGTVDTRLMMRKRWVSGCYYKHIPLFFFEKTETKLSRLHKHQSISCSYTCKSREAVSMSFSLIIPSQRKMTLVLQSTSSISFDQP